MSVCWGTFVVFLRPGTLDRNGNRVTNNESAFFYAGPVNLNNVAGCANMRRDLHAKGWTDAHLQLRMILQPSDTAANQRHQGATT